MYKYIAESNPDCANEICKKYGYLEIENLDELAYCLNAIVANYGESALIEVLDIHPDKDTILEAFQKKTEVIITKDQPRQQSQQPPQGGQQQDIQSTQPAKTTTFSSSLSISQTNTFILIGAVVIAFAIIVNKSK